MGLPGLCRVGCSPSIQHCADLIHQYDDAVLLVTGPATGPEGTLIDTARDAGIAIEMVDSLQRNLHPLRDGAAYREVRRALAQFNPEVVHTHSAKAGMLGRAAAASLRVPVVVHTVHGAPFHPYQSAAARELFRRCEGMTGSHSEGSRRGRVAPRDVRHRRS